MEEFTIKKDIKGIHIFLDITGDYIFTTDNDNKADKIIRALEKQIPKTVNRVDTEINNYRFYYCLGCGINLESKLNYCSHCGQRLDWD